MVLQFVQLDKQQIENFQRCMFCIIAFLFVLALGLLNIEFVIAIDDLIATSILVSIRCTLLYTKIRCARR